MSWHGHIFLESGWLLYDGPVTATSAHAHHAMQLVLASDPPVELIMPPHRASVEVAAIPADTLHAFASATRRTVILYIAPESGAGRRLAAQLRSTDHDGRFGEDVLGSDLVRGPVERWEEARRIYSTVLGRLTGLVGSTRPWPPAITRMVAMLPTRLDGELRLREIARELGVSEGHLAHLIAEHLGIPFRPYVLWLRLQRAAAEMASGRPLTVAAHGAGFSDSAHFSRVFRRMFGITPSELARAARWHLGAREEPSP